MIRWLTIGVLTLGIIGVAYWGYGEQQKNTVLTQTAENNYQRSFHELVYHIDQLEDNLGTVLAMNTRRQLSPKLADVWRITSLAQSELGKLPLGLMPFSKTDEFLYQVGNFSYKAAVRDLDKEPLTEAEFKTIEQLHQFSKEVQNELRKTQAFVLRDNINWLDVEEEAMAQNEPLNNAVLNGFHIVDEKVKGLSEVDFGPNVPQLDTQNGEELNKQLKGKKEVSEGEASAKALRFLGLNPNTPVHVADTGDGIAYKAYSLTINDPNHDTHYFMDMTKKGGLPIWFLQDRPIEEINISLNEASQKAEAFLKRNGFKNMQLIDSHQYDSIGVFEFAYLLDNVRVYTDSIFVEVALNDGEVVAYNGINYLTNHKEREKVEPTITKDEANGFLNSSLEVMEDHLALIKNEVGDEVLCYEFYGTRKNDTFRIFINANDGQEELVEKLGQIEPAYELM